MSLTLLLIGLTAFQDRTLPDLESMFLQERRNAFAVMLSDHVRIQTDLRPVLADFGSLNSFQLLLAYDKLHHRFHVRQARVVNSQSDTNYAWLEIYMEAELENKRSGQTLLVTFAFHFKTAGRHMVINRWVLQDIH